MQKKKSILIFGQLIVLAAFWIMAAACATQNEVTTTEVHRASVEKCDPTEYVFIGCYDTEAEAKQASQNMGFTSYCYENTKCYGKK